MTNLAHNKDETVSIAFRLKYDELDVCRVCLLVLAVTSPHLNEHQIPDLQNIGVIHVDQVGGISAPHSVVVDLSARPTWPLIAHLPEIVLGPKGQNPFCWQELQPANTRVTTLKLSAITVMVNNAFWHRLAACCAL